MAKHTTVEHMVSQHSPQQTESTNVPIRISLIWSRRSRVRLRSVVPQLWHKQNHLFLAVWPFVCVRVYFLLRTFLMVWDCVDEAVLFWEGFYSSRWVEGESLGIQRWFSSTFRPQSFGFKRFRSVMTIKALLLAAKRWDCRYYAL